MPSLSGHDPQIVAASNIVYSRTIINIVFLRGTIATRLSAPVMRVMPAESPQSHYSSAASCISAWLARQPDPQYYQREESLPAFAQGTKRSRRTYTTDIPASGFALPQKRPKLSPITGNRMATPIRHSPRIYKDKQNMKDNTLLRRSNASTIDGNLNIDIHMPRNSPIDTRTLPTRRDIRLKRKSPSQGFDECSDSESPTKRVAHHPFDSEKTPRGPILGITPPLNLSEPTLTPISPRSENSYASSTSQSTGGSLTSRRGPGGSPRKISRMGDLRFAAIPVEKKVLGGRGTEIPQEMRRLYNDMGNIHKGRGTIPTAVSEKMREMGEEVDSIDLKEEDEEDRTTDLMLGTLSQEGEWVRAVEIWQSALKCQERDLPEASWNSEVHSRLLSLALRGQWEARGITYVDVTTARITDTSLLPLDVTTGPMQGKVVDFAMIVDPPKSILEFLVAKIASQGSKSSINQTAAEWIRFSPIGVSFETKREGEGGDTAQVQVSAWLSAHFAKLLQLTDRHTKLPCLLGVIVQGHTWSMVIAVMKETVDNGALAEAADDAEEVEHTVTKRRIEILGSILLGDTRTIAGVYQNLAAIRRLARWIDEQYWPWFRREVLGVVEQPKAGS